MSDEPTELPVPPVVQAVRATTGTGKTTMFADIAAETRLQRRAAGMQTKVDKASFGYFVPTHKLSEDVADLWRERGLTAQVYYGREHEVDGEPMCLNLQQVELARILVCRIAESCCKNGDDRCGLLGSCRWQSQFPAEGTVPDVWVAAHQMLFHEQQRFGNIAAVCVDESFWEAGIFGLGKDKWHLDIAEIGSREIPSDSAIEWLSRPQPRQQAQAPGASARTAAGAGRPAAEPSPRRGLDRARVRRSDQNGVRRDAQARSASRHVDSGAEELQGAQ